MRAVRFDEYGGFDVLAVSYGDMQVEHIREAAMARSRRSSIHSAAGSAPAAGAAPLGQAATRRRSRLVV
jgi:hypothetical protein